MNYMLTSFLSYIKYIVGTLFVLTLFFAGMVFFIVHHTVVDFSPLTSYQSAKPSVLLDDEGNEWGRFQLDRREPIRLDQMPPHLIQAFLAAEDWQFFSHSGLSVRGIIRSTLVNIYNGRIVQGASTITQQLVRLLFFDSKRTFKRKIKEQLYALLIEQQCTKEQILQTYLNHIYFGCGIYGVEAACQRFWGISATAISIDQAAVLASIVPSPGNYCPLLRPLNAERRRTIVLRSMKKLRFITHDQYEAAVATSVDVIDAAAFEIAPHAKEMIRQYLEELVGRHELYCGGLTIATTLNQVLQEKAEKVFKSHVAQLRAQLKLPLDGAMLSIEPSTGEIKVLIGGYDFVRSKFNRVTQAKRQLGSIIKPLVYAAAIQDGMTFADTDIDEPLEFDDHGRLWAPNNYHLGFDGQMTLAYALSHSNNILAIKALLKVGAASVVSLAEKAHFHEPIRPYPALALGCVDVTLQEAVAMFSIFAHDGVYMQPHIVAWVKDCWGTKIIKTSPVRERIITSRVAGAVAKVLELGIERVRTKLQDPIIDSHVITKTGTTNDSRTCWFVGATPTLATGIYIGCDDNSSLGKNVFPIATAFPIWCDVYRGLQVAKKQFSYDPSLKEIWIDEKTGLPSVAARKGAIAIMV